MVSIRYFAPAPALRGYISSYYWFEANAPRIDDLLRAELAQVRFLITGRARYHFGGRAVACPSTLLNGPTSAPVRFVATGPLKVFGAGLMPAGWATLIGAPADQLANNVIDLGAIAGQEADYCRDRIANASTDVARVAAADAFFGDLLARPHATPLWFTRLTDEWLTATPNPQVEDLVAASGMSARQIERMTRRIYGASPKLLARKYRALQAAVRLGTCDGGWADAAGDAFYDQSHFIREFKQFVGMTPSRFAAEAAPVSRLTIARRRMLPSLPKLALYS